MSIGNLFECRSGDVRPIRPSMSCSVAILVTLIFGFGCYSVALVAAHDLPVSTLAEALESGTSFSTVPTENELRIAVVKPIFSDTAYSNAFYNFYQKYGHSSKPYITTDLHLLNVTVESDWGWSTGLHTFLNSPKARLAGVGLCQSVAVIDEIDVTMGALFREGRRAYDAVILGFTEYVTAEEYYAYRRFVETGGTLIIMDACNFLAEVKYHPSASPDEPGYLSLVRGHGWEFNGTHAWKSDFHRWPDENRNWVASNFWTYWSGQHYDYFLANTSHPISSYIRCNYGENITSPYGAHEENKLQNLTDTEVIGYWHFKYPSETPDEPIAAYQHWYGNGSVFHTGIMGSDVISSVEFMQAFLVSAVRYALTGSYANWSFWEDSTYEAYVDLFYKNGTKLAQNDLLYDKVYFHVVSNASTIAQNHQPYKLTSVYVRVEREQDPSFLPITYQGNPLDQCSQCWRVDVDTRYLLDGEYSFEVWCSFTSLSNMSDSIDSIVVMSRYIVKNISDELRFAISAAFISLLSLSVLASAFVVWRGRSS